MKRVMTMRNVPHLYMTGRKVKRYDLRNALHRVFGGKSPPSPFHRLPDDAIVHCLKRRGRSYPLPVKEAHGTTFHTDRCLCRSVSCRYSRTGIGKFPHTFSRGPVHLYRRKRRGIPPGLLYSVPTLRIPGRLFFFSLNLKIKVSFS